MSGTSMAAPNVAGVAALGVQAHPEWTGQEVAAALVSTSDPRDIAGYRLTRGGGLVDTAALVNGQVFAYGDTVAAGDGTYRESVLSFGFAELGADFKATKTVTVVNKGTSERTFNVSYEATQQSLRGSVSFDKTSVTVPAGGTADVKATLSVKATDIPPTLSTRTQHGFFEVSGNVVLTSGDDRLTVGSLLVPRQKTNVSASLNKGNLNPRAGGTTVTITNRGGVTAGDADTFTWGHQDAKDQTVPGGFDLQAAGVQAYVDGDEATLVFAVSTHDRWSNAASVEFDVVIDKDRDGTPDLAVFSYDSGAIQTGDPDGLAEVFIYDYATKKLSSAGYLSVSPTDSSTILIPVDTADLGITGAFNYTVESYFGDADVDWFDNWATYNPFAKAITDADYTQVGPNGTASLQVVVNKAAYDATKPLGLMVVSYDNAAGKEVSLLRGK